MSYLSEIRTLVDESSAAFWSDNQVCDAANEALLNGALRLRCKQISVDLEVPQNSDIVALPATVMIPQRAIREDHVYFFTTQAHLEQYDRDWRTHDPSEPTHLILWDTSHIRVWPKPDKAYTFSIHGIAWPSEISVDAPTLSEPSLVQSAFSHHAAAILLDATRPDLADALRNEAADLEHRRTIQLRNQQSHNILHFRPIRQTRRGTGITQEKVSPPKTWNELTQTWDQLTMTWDQL